MQFLFDLTSTHAGAGVGVQFLVGTTNNTLLLGDFNRDGHVDARDIMPMMQA